jgi:hypothetical protein
MDPKKVDKEAVLARLQEALNLINLTHYVRLLKTCGVRQPRVWRDAV